MYLKFFIFLACLILNINCFAFEHTSLKSFETDFCTSWPDSNDEFDWSQCCLVHDLYYWAGGTLIHRDRVDLEFKSCVQESSTDFMAQVMYLGVRLGSKSPFKLKGKHWGNAWGDKPRGTKLTQSEIELLKSSLFQSNIERLTTAEILQLIADLKDQESLSIENQTSSF